MLHCWHFMFIVLICYAVPFKIVWKGKSTVEYLSILISSLKVYKSTACKWQKIRLTKGELCSGNLKVLLILHSPNEKKVHFCVYSSSKVNPIAGIVSVYWHCLAWQFSSPASKWQVFHLYKHFLEESKRRNGPTFCIPGQGVFSVSSWPYGL